MTTPALTPDQLAGIGRALYGELWQAEMARALGVADRSIRRWLAGDRAVGAGVAEDLATICATRGQALAQWAQIIRLSLPARRDPPPG
jgi:hypothetical protein